MGFLVTMLLLAVFIYLMLVVLCAINNFPDSLHYKRAYKALTSPDCVLLSMDYEYYKEHGCWFFQSGDCYLAWSQKSGGFGITDAHGNAVHKICGVYPYLFDWYTLYWFKKIDKYLREYKAEHKHPPFKNIHE